MNARGVKVLWVVCLLVVGLVAALETTAPAEPPSMEYRPAVNSLYRSYGYNTVPQVNVPVYDGTDSKLPPFYRGWTVESVAEVSPAPAPYVTWNDLMNDYDPQNYVVPLVTWSTPTWSDPAQAGGYDPWDPFGNAFGVAESLAAATVPEGVWDDDGVPNNTVPVEPKPVFEWSDPAQPGGYDPWDPLGNSFGLVGNK